MEELEGEEVVGPEVGDDGVMNPVLWGSVHSNAER